MISLCVFTSPISSNPSLEVIKKCISSFPIFSNSYIFCDGYKINENRRFRNKFGQVNQKEVDNYEQFKKNLNQEFKNFKIYESTKWRGFAKMLNLAVHLVDTRHVFVVQHDWELRSKLDVGEIEKELEENNVHYLVLRSKLMHYDEDLKLVGGEEFLKHATKDFVPFFHWHDKPHFAKVSKYIEIFQKHKIKRFPEDEYGQLLHKKFLKKKLKIFNENRNFMLKDSLIRHLSGRHN